MSITTSSPPKGKTTFILQHLPTKFLSFQTSIKKVGFHSCCKLQKQYNFHLVQESRRALRYDSNLAESGLTAGGFCLMASKMSFACQHEFIVKRGSPPCHAKGWRNATAISFTPNQCSDSMAPPLGSSRLICFYCGRKSPLRQDGSVREWECRNCEAVNYLDEVNEPLQLRRFYTYIMIEWRNYGSTCRYGRGSPEYGPICTKI